MIGEEGGPAGPKVLRLLYFVGAGCQYFLFLFLSQFLQHRIFNSNPPLIYQLSARQRSTSGEISSGNQFSSTPVSCLKSLLIISGPRVSCTISVTEYSHVFAYTLIIDFEIEDRYLFSSQNLVDVNPLSNKLSAFVDKSTKHVHFLSEIGPFWCFAF